MLFLFALDVDFGLIPPFLLLVHSWVDLFCVDVLISAKAMLLSSLVLDEVVVAGHPLSKLQQPLLYFLGATNFRTF